MNVRRFRVVAVGIVSLLALASGCVTREVNVRVDASALPNGDDLAFTVNLYADDGGGCAAWRFALAPALTPLSSFALSDDSDALRLPRLGTKLIVVDAARAGASVGRGCREVGVVDDHVDVDVVLAPTARVRARGPSPAELSASDSIRFVVEDSGDLPVGGHSVHVEGKDGSGDIVFAFDRASDDDGVVDVDVGARAAAAGLGPVDVSATVTNPFDDTPARVLALRAPAVDDAGVGDDLADATPVFQNGALAYVGHAGGATVVDVPSADGAAARTVLAGAADRFLGAFFGDGGTLFFFVVTEPDDPDGRRLHVVDAAGAVVASLAIGGGVDLDHALAVGVGSCRGGDDRDATRPLLISDGVHAAFVDVAFGALVVRAASARDAPILGARRSLCPIDETGVRRRVLFGVGSDRFAPVVVDDFDAIGDVDTARIAALAAPAGVVRYDLADDGALLAAVQVAAVTEVRSFVVSDAGLVAVAVDAVPLSAVPAFLARGHFGGDDVVTVAALDVSSGANPGATALFVQSGSLAVAGGPICAPALACSATLSAGGAFFTVRDGRAVVVRF